MDSKGLELKHSYKLKWQEPNGESTLDITLLDNGDLAFAMGGVVRDPATGDMEPYKGPVVTVPDSHIDRLVEAIVLIQIKRKETRSLGEPHV